MDNVNAQDILLQHCSVKNDTIMSENKEGAGMEEEEEEEEVREEAQEVEEALTEEVAPEEQEEGEVVPRTIQDILVSSCNSLQSQHKHFVLSSLDHSTVESIY